MKRLNSYVNEVLVHGNFGKNLIHYTCKPADKFELRDIIIDRIKNEGPECDLNDIDVSNITDMSTLFFNLNFNGDISMWDVSNVKNMQEMFSFSQFNGDISKWDVGNVTNMFSMFVRSKFNGDISKWNVRNVWNIGYMFYKAQFNNDISMWNVDNVQLHDNAFEHCPIPEKYKPKFK